MDQINYTLKANKKIRLNKKDIEILKKYFYQYLFYLENNNIVYEHWLIKDVLSELKKLTSLHQKFCNGRKKGVIYQINLFYVNEFRKIPNISDNEFFPYIWAKIVL